MFQNECSSVFSTDWRIVNLDNLFDVLLNKSGAWEPRPSHNLWRINRMASARILRKVIPQPKILPLNSGIDIERYIAIDINGGITYQLPSTDCSNMFVHQAIGSRMIHLQPTSECKNQCRRLSVRLKKNQICNALEILWILYCIFTHVLNFFLLLQCFMIGGITSQFPQISTQK